MIYLDSAATTLQKPPAVARAVSSAVGRLATPGRGGHVPAMRAAETAFLCRQAAAELFQVESPEQVVFTSNATHGLNLAIHSLLKPGWLQARSLIRRLKSAPLSASWTRR